MSFSSCLVQARGLDLSRVRACVVVAEERPRMSLTHSFSKLFKDLGLHPRSVSTAFGCRVNLAICLQVRRIFTPSRHCPTVTRSLCLCCDWLQGTSGPDPTTVYVDMRALRHDRYGAILSTPLSHAAARTNPLLVLFQGPPGGARVSSQSAVNGVGQGERESRDAADDHNTASLRSIKNKVAYTLFSELVLALWGTMWLCHVTHEPQLKHQHGGSLKDRRLDCACVQSSC